MRRALPISIALCLSWAYMPTMTHAAGPLTYSYKHHLFTLYPSAQRDWATPSKQWYYRGVPAEPTFCAEACDDVEPPAGWTSEPKAGWNRAAIAATLQNKIGVALDREPGNVVISRTGSGEIVFDGEGLTGRKVDIEWATDATLQALESGVEDIVLRVTESQPSVSVEDPELAAMGIKEVVTVGESDFTGSPVNRQHNIRVGLSKFNGVIIPQGVTFSFNAALGPVNATTGYRKELVILGTHTLPDYGGGLCQVSSTAYRGIWEYGFPIAQRKNHSYTVSYYSPQGTDATIYPPNVDLKFVNDSPGALLLQTFTDEEHHAYFVYYGTKDARQSEVFGPYTWGTTPAPEDKKIEYTTDIPPGTERKVGSKVPGMRTSWFRTVTQPDGSVKTSETFSSYEARPLFYQVGVTPEEMARLTDSERIDEPSWLPTTD